MLAIVCKTYEGVKALEIYDGEGFMIKGSGIHGLGASVGQDLKGRFSVICLENLRHDVQKLYVVKWSLYISTINSSLCADHILVIFCPMIPRKDLIFRSQECLLVIFHLAFLVML